MLLGKNKYILPILFGVIAVFCYIPKSIGAPSSDEARRRFGEEYQKAVDRPAFLAKSAKEAVLRGDSEGGKTIAEAILAKMRREGRAKKKHPELLSAVKELEHYKDLQIAHRATILRQKMEDRFEFLDFMQGLKQASDKKTFLYSHADSESDWVLFNLAYQLGKYDDPESIAILKKIKKHQSTKSWNEDEGPRRASVEAEESLDKIEARAALKGLDTADTPWSEKEKLVRQYALNWKGAFQEKIQKFLWDTVKENPAFAVPLMVEFEAQYMANYKDICDNYPQFIDQGLDRCLDSPNDSQVAACVKFIGEANKVEYFGRVLDVIYNEKGELDYSGETPNAHSRYQAMNVFGYRKNESIPYLEKILYVRDKYINDKKDALYIIGSLNNEISNDIINKFISSKNSSLDIKTDSGSTFRDLAVDLIRRTKVSE